MIDKSRIDQQHTTNTTAVMSGTGTLFALVNGLLQHQDYGQWVPIVMMGTATTIAQWLQGTPSPLTQSIASVLRLNGSTNNAQVIRFAIDRLLTSGIVPGMGAEPMQRPMSNQAPPRFEPVGPPPQSAPMRQRSRQPMTRSDWQDWSQQDGKYPEIIQTGFDPNDIGPSTEAR